MLLAGCSQERKSDIEGHCTGRLCGSLLGQPFASANLIGHVDDYEKIHDQSAGTNPGDPMTEFIDFDRQVDSTRPNGEPGRPAAILPSSPGTAS